MIRLLIPLLVLIALTQEQTIPNSPCYGIFDYEPIGEEKNRWYGVIHLSTDTPLRALWLSIELDGKADLLGNWVGDVSTKDNKNYAIENTQMMIKPGPPVDIRFFVQYNVLDRTPRLQSIKFNGREICNANNRQPVIDSPGGNDLSSQPLVSAIKPQSRPMTPNFGVVSSPIPPPVTTTSVKPPPANTYDAQGQCGRVINPSALIVEGTVTKAGLWPWQVALYHMEVAASKFACGGTLVTHKHIITAAHCVTQKKSKRLLNLSSLIVFLGKHNLQWNTPDVQIKFVEEVLVHPQYDPNRFYVDVAIITLSSPVLYSDSVQPACLWPDHLVAISNIVGLKGTVVGWGFDITGLLTEELNVIEMQVVNVETCLRSKNEFYNRFTSDYTYCAGNKDGSSVCNGDSGGGMVFRGTDESWYLRGLVSLTVAMLSSDRCDPNEYVIFTDLAQLLPWIKSNINDN